MLIYKILTDDEWLDLHVNGETGGAPIDIQDGFIHLSTAAQAPETVSRHFAEQADLWIIAVDTDALGDDLRWEPSRGGALFPHLYAKLRHADVIWSKPLPISAEGHLFPAEMT
ncbi:MAG: DUF952 domain-containing protein [Pseudomonadota bacterium]